MKATHTTAFSLLFLTATITSAQIPNSGFEDWVQHEGHWDPVGWWTANDSIGGGGWFPAERSSDHYPINVGESSLLLKNNTLLLPGWGAMGIAWTGDFEGNNAPVFPVTGHPTSLWGWYKFTPQNGDSMEVHVRLYQDGVDVGGGSYKSDEATTGWTAFGITFNAYDEADSARIMISACYDNDAPVPHGNSSLLVDNLNFDELITGLDDLNAAPAISVYPNPAKDILNVVFGEVPGTHVYVTLIDGAGRVAHTQDLSAHTRMAVIDVAGLAEGSYILQVQVDAQQIHSTRVVVAH